MWENKIGCCYMSASIIMLWQYNLASRSVGKDFAKQVSACMFKAVNLKLLRMVQRI